MPHLELDRQSRSLLQLMSGDFADRYIEEMLTPQLEAALQLYSSTPEELSERFSDPFYCLRAFYHHYAFARRGKDRRELGEIATQALRFVTSPEQVEDFLCLKDAGSLWDAFVRICKERHRKPAEQLNRGLLAGVAELAQEVYCIDREGSLMNWVVRGVVQTGRLEPQFLRIVDIRGVGPKSTAMLLRDIVHIANLEDEVDHQDRLYVQPIDRWIRLLSGYVVPEIGVEDAADWIIAGKLAKYARHAGVSGIRFNMGASYFGITHVLEPSRFRQEIEQVIKPEDRRQTQPYSTRGASHQA